VTRKDNIQYPSSTNKDMKNVASLLQMKWHESKRSQSRHHIHMRPVQIRNFSCLNIWNLFFCLLHLLDFTFIIYSFIYSWFHWGAYTQLFYSKTIKVITVKVVLNEKNTQNKRVVEASYSIFKSIFSIIIIFIVIVFKK